MLEEINEFDFENRIVSNEYDSTQDAEVENNLRPKTLNDYVGQEKAKSNLKVYVNILWILWINDSHDFIMRKSGSQ